MLEGWCRFGVQELISNSLYKSAHITHLDRNKAGNSSFSFVHYSRCSLISLLLHRCLVLTRGEHVLVLYAEMEQGEKDPEVQVLSRQFKAIAEELISLLEQVTYLE